MALRAGVKGKEEEIGGGEVSERKRTPLRARAGLWQKFQSMERVRICRGPPTGNRPHPLW